MTPMVDNNIFFKVSGW